MDYESVRRTGGAVVPDIMSDVRPPHGRRFWVTEEMVAQSTDRKKNVRPIFTITQVASVFFARSSDWIRYIDGLGEDGFYLDGHKLMPARTESAARYYTLADVEKMAHALLNNDRIDPMQFAGTINIVRWIACLYKLIPYSDMISLRQGPPPHPPVAGQLPIPGIDEELGVRQ